MGLPGVKMNVTLAMMLAFGIALLAELIRHRNLRIVLKSTTIFFEGMGNQFSYAVTLIYRWTSLCTRLSEFRPY